MKSGTVAYLTEKRTSSKYFNDILFLKKWLDFFYSVKLFLPNWIGYRPIYILFELVLELILKL